MSDTGTGDPIPESGQLGNPYSMPTRERMAQQAVMRPDQTPLRKGDTGLGRPDLKPGAARLLTKEEKQEYRDAEDAELREAFARKLKALNDAGGLQLPKSIRRAFFWLVLAVTSVLALFVVVETSRFLTGLAEMPRAYAWTALAGVLVFGGILLYIIVKMLALALRLSQSPAIPLTALSVLNEREQWRRLARAHQQEGRETLRGYLNGFDPACADERHTLLALGMTEQEHNSLVQARARLLDVDPPMTAHVWLASYADQFQGVQDAAALRRIKWYAKRVAFGTATSPIPIVDQMIVLYACMKLVGELLQVYHVRPAWGQTITLLARSVVHTYLSGIIEETAEGAMDSLADQFNEELSAAVGSGLMRTVSAKLAEASLNGYMIYRLGKTTIRMLRPVDVEPK